jgi:hypothetical protein
MPGARPNNRCFVSKSRTFRLEASCLLLQVRLRHVVELFEDLITIGCDLCRVQRVLPDVLFEKPLARQSSVFGLIVESDFDRTELNGFEVDMNGGVVTPELHPQRLCTGSLPAILKISALFMPAKENAA